MLKRKIWKNDRDGKQESCGSSASARYLCRFGQWRQALVVVWILLMTACTAPLPPPGAIFSPGGPGLFKKTPSDADIMHEGITYLGSPGRVAEYARARSAFDTLIKIYPESKWRPLAETMITLIDNRVSCQANNLLAGRKEDDTSSLRQENERLKKEVRYLNEKLKTDTARLSEENEQMKKDIQLLKNLEVELEKREKMLR